MALEMVVIVTGDLVRSGPPAAASPAFGLVGATVVGLGTMVMRGFCRPRVGMMVVLEKKSSALGLVISSVAVLFWWLGVTRMCSGCPGFWDMVSSGGGAQEGVVCPFTLGNVLSGGVWVTVTGSFLFIQGIQDFLMFSSAAAGG